MGVNGKQDDTRYIICQQKKREKQGKNWKNRRKNRKKHRKLREIQKQDFDEVPGNAENGKEFSARFWEMLKTETRTKTRSSQMSQNNDLRAKTMYRPTPTPDSEPDSRLLTLNPTPDSESDSRLQTLNQTPISESDSRLQTLIHTPDSRLLIRL